MNSSIGGDPNARSEHQRRARQLHDQIRTFMQRDVRETGDIIGQLAIQRLKSFGRHLPLIPVLAERIALDAEPVDADRIRCVTAFVLNVELHQENIAVADLRHCPKLMAKLGDLMGDQISRDLLGMLLYSRRIYDRVTLCAAYPEGVEPGLPNRRALLSCLSELFDFLLTGIRLYPIPHSQSDNDQ